jgi:hypothetical protein
MNTIKLSKPVIMKQLTTQMVSAANRPKPPSQPALLECVRPRISLEGRTIRQPRTRSSVFGACGNLSNVNSLCEMVARLRVVVAADCESACSNQVSR